MSHADWPVLRSSAGGPLLSKAGASKDVWLSPGARSGVASFLVHVVVLLALAMVYGYERPLPLKPIALSFHDTTDSINMEPVAAEIAVDLPSVSEEQEQHEHDELLAALEDIQEAAVEVSPVAVEQVSEVDTIRSAFSQANTTQLNAVLVADNSERLAPLDDAIAASSPRPFAMVGINGGNVAAGRVAEGRNPSGRISSSDFGDRLQAAGAQTGDVQISLAWNTIDDIDLHVSYTPGNGLIDNIDWTNRVGRLSGGMLDIDMNANSSAISATPVENVFWPMGSSPRGHFVVSINFFRSWTGNTKVPVFVRVKNGDSVKLFPIVAHLYGGVQQVHAFSFRTKEDRLAF